jgi:hypothetical protein
MRIAHITDVSLPHLGGIEIFVDDVARRQAVAGHQVAVLTGSPGPTAGDDSGVEIVRPTSLVSAGAHAMSVHRRITERQFDVVHGHRPCCRRSPPC